MSRFHDSWLALREPVDARARSDALARALSTEATTEPRRIIDLGAGTGSNLRYLAPRLGPEQDWLLVDHDEALLDIAAERLAAWSRAQGLALQERGETLILRGPRLQCRVRRLKLDLVRDTRELSFDDCWLLTASALLDLVSRDWLEAVVGSARKVGAHILFALTYDGEIGWQPALGDDARITAAVNDHQMRDKGFGPALGPSSASIIPNLLRIHGYEVTEAYTPWDIRPDEHALQETLIRGWTEAAIEQTLTDVERITHWRRERQSLARAGKSVLRVGHRDILASPAEG